MVLVEQYRHGTDEMTIEIPGGAVDPGESPATAAARELEEETGYRASELIEIGRVDPNPAFLSNRCWTYLALGCRSDGTVNLDPSEEIEVSLAPIEDFARLIDDGTITHSLVIAAHDHLQRGFGAERSGRRDFGISEHEYVQPALEVAKWRRRLVSVIEPRSRSPRAVAANTRPGTLATTLVPNNAKGGSLAARTPRRIAGRVTPGHHGKAP